jgi:hypothetical protein
MLTRYSLQLEISIEDTLFFCGGGELRQMLRKILLIICIAVALYSVAPAQTTSELARKFDEFGDLCLKSRTSGLDTVSTGSDSDLVSDQHAIFLNDS